jgi:hypothetical protein
VTRADQIRGPTVHTVDLGQMRLDMPRVQREDLALKALKALLALFGAKLRRGRVACRSRPTRSSSWLLSGFTTHIFVFSSQIAQISVERTCLNAQVVG